MTSAARLRPEVSGMPVTGAAAFWQIGTSHRAHDVFGYSRAVSGLVDPTTQTVRDLPTTPAAKQASPPRGVPR